MAFTWGHGARNHNQIPRGVYWATRMRGATDAGIGRGNREVLRGDLGVKKSGESQVEAQQDKVLQALVQLRCLK